MSVSKLENKLAAHIRVAGLPAPEREYRFWPGRRFRFDFAWPEQMIAVEVEGGTWTRGRHNRGKGFESDCEKYNEAALQGWIVLRFTGAMVRDRRAIETVKRALGE
jgi:very-short-patch-repair endonuclease